MITLGDVKSLLKFFFASGGDSCSWLRRVDTENRAVQCKYREQGCSMEVQRTGLFNASTNNFYHNREMKRKKDRKTKRWRAKERDRGRWRQAKTLRVKSIIRTLENTEKRWRYVKKNGINYWTVWSEIKHGQQEMNQNTPVMWCKQRHNGVVGC